LDLSKAQHPKSALTLAIHPECTINVPLWKTILSNIINATTGTCLIATFKDHEMEVVRGVCQEMRQDFEVHRNPYWQTRPEPEGHVPPYLSYLIVVRRNGK